MATLHRAFLGMLVFGLFSQHAFGALLFSDTPENIGTTNADFAQYTFGNRFRVHVRFSECPCKALLPQGSAERSWENAQVSEAWSGRRRQGPQ